MCTGNLVRSEPPNKELWMNYQKQTQDIICMQTIVKKETIHSGKDTLLYSVAKRLTWKLISVEEFYFNGHFSLGKLKYFFHH